MNATKTGFRIKDLCQNVGDHGCSWTIVWTDPFECPLYHHHSLTQPSEREYQTNGAGEALFILGTDGDWHQIEGTCQFGVVVDRAAVRRKIRWYFNG